MFNIQPLHCQGNFPNNGNSHSSLKEKQRVKSIHSFRLMQECGSDIFFDGSGSGQAGKKFGSVSGSDLKSK